ncbi:hypothetical protein ACFW91_25120 [Streptomyces asoensis]|uniref:hypothetical protein n=1 Tax=Streptomyces asoensis TaxID=249586 RepID=UPI0036C09125
MTETSPERPPVADLATIVGSPIVTFLARTDEVVLGDTVDSTDGLVRVREIVQRPGRWDLAGDAPGDVIRFVHDLRADNPEPRTRVSLHPHTRIRVRRPVTYFGRLTGHSKKVTSRNPVKRGMYTHVDGYTAGCSCGWTSPAVHPGPTTAGKTWLDHKAAQITDAAYLSNSALMFIATAEAVQPDLPLLCWQFRSVASGENAGQGIANADLSTLPLDRARAVMAAWRAVPGLTTSDEYSWDREEDAVVHTLRGPRRQIADLRLHLAGPHGEQLIIDADYYAPVPSGDGPW